MSDDSNMPSCSKSLNKVESKTSIETDNDMELYITNEKAEIERLESSDIINKIEKDDKEDVPVDDERIAKINFHCTSCDMQEMVHYFGTQPPFVYGIEFSEPTYVLRDPFQAPPPRWKSKAEYFVALGAHCQNCDSVVCKDTECSFFYIRTYCLACVRKVATTLPLDIQQKLRKLLALSQL